MNTTKLSAIINRIDSFPTLPSIVAQVLEVTTSRESTVGDLSQVIMPDQAMTMSVLKIANSAFFGLPRKVATLQHAVSIIGFDEIRNLVLAKSICRSLKSIDTRAEFDIRQFWSHSFLTGLTARIIAADHMKNSNEFFVAGLIHDIGKLIIYMAFPKEYSRLAAANAMGRTPLLESEKSAFGLAHDAVGLRLANRWFLPPSLTAAAGFHHHPHHAQNANEFALIVHLADIIARMFETKQDQSAYNELRQSLSSPDIIRLSESCSVKISDAEIERYEQEFKAGRNENMAILQMIIG